MEIKLCRPREAFAISGLTKGSWYRQQQHGLVPPFLKIAPRCAAVPQHELEEVIAARISGKNDNEIRKLVVELVAARADPQPKKP